MMSQPDTSIRDTWSALLFCLALLISALPGPALALQARGSLQLPKLPIRKTQRTGAFYFEKTVTSPAAGTSFEEETPQDSSLRAHYPASHGRVPRSQVVRVSKAFLPIVTPKISAHLVKSVLNL
jgi:hypothetical protein